MTRKGAGMLDGLKLKETDADRRVAEVAYRASRDELSGFVSELEDLELERAALAERQREIFAAAKGRGYDVRAIRALIRRRKDPASADALDAVLALYLDVLGGEDA